MRSYVLTGLMILFIMLAFRSTAQQIDSLKNITITVTFASPPSTFTVTKAPLRYNKSFAYSFQIDDGGKDIYTHGFPFFEGGTVAGTTFPGLKFTDGCGNDQYFKMSTSLFSFSTYGGGENDMHDPASAFALLNVTWPEVIELYQHSWGISNHGLTSSSTGNTQYDISRNHSYVKLKTQAATSGGIDMEIFVNPNGAEVYTPVAFANGYLVCYRVGYTLGDPSLDVTSTWDHSQIKMGRSGVGNTASLSPLVDAMAAASNGNARHWGVHFTHAITNGSYGYDFATFQTAMNYVANTYGKTGLDNIWMATEEEVLDYLLIKDAITVNTLLTGSVLKITFSGTIPSSYKYYIHSLKVNADQPITSIAASGVATKTYNGIGTTNSLINIAWNGHYIIPPEVNAETWVSKTETTHSQYDANVAMDYVLMVPAGTVQQAFRLRLCSVTGITLPSSFCNMRNAPKASLPTLSSCPNIQVPIPIIVNGFTNITSVSLRMDYDPALITFVSGTAGKPSVLTGMQITSSPIGSGSPLNKLLITWSSTTSKSLAATDTLVKLVFNNVTGSTPLAFNTTSGGSADCEYKDENSNVMIDFPTATYYVDGQVNFLGLPAPGLITGPSSLCPGTSGHVYTVPAVTGATSYVWTYPSGFTPVSGQNTSAITLSASPSAASGSIAVKAVNACSDNPVSQPYPVLVKSKPFPTITGSTLLCSATNNVSYATESGMDGYTWNISPGGIITAGAGTSSILVFWNNAGSQQVNVSYTAANGCSATPPAVETVTVNARPVPTISGSASGCLNAPSNFSTEPGMSQYTWTVSPGGSIVSGSNSATVTVNWINPGPQTVSVNYLNLNGCTGLNPVVKPVSVVVPPTPAINGLGTACVGSANLLYSTDAGMINYTWVISNGGIINSGAGTNVIMVTWNAVGNQSVSVNYSNPSGCTANSPTVKNVLVNPLPVPTLSGPGSVCKGTSGEIYSTEPGMANYQWSISSGGNITSGGNTNIVSVTWTSAGLQIIGVNYTMANGCRAGAPALKNVTVKPLPLPAISGNDSTCINEIVTYVTDTGMINYQWTVTGGTIISGTGASTLQVQWIVAGIKTLSVNYTNPLTGCTGASPTIKTIRVFPLPVPSVLGPGLICEGATGISYATENGMTNYTWTISAGGTITSGAGTNLISVTWHVPGLQWVGVSYTNEKGCVAASPVLKNVTVLALPVPTVAGMDSVCVNQLSDYLTESGMSDYQWSISAGGNISWGAGSNFIHVLWTTVGTKSVSVSYTSPDGCVSAIPGVKTVVVSHLNPTIAGATAACAGSSGLAYTTQPGMVNYAWSVSSGGIITSGFGTNSIIVTWNTPGIQAVSVNYSNSYGCTAPNPANLVVTVNPLPVPTITGNTQLCMNSGSYPYLTQPGMINYLWSITSGGIITSGQGTNSIMVNWTIPGVHSVNVNYTNINGCNPVTPAILPVTVNSIPGTPGAITGATLICKPKNGVVYSVAAVSLATGYLWNLPPGAVITNGANTRMITVNFNSAAQSGDISVIGINSCGPGPVSPALPVSVYPYPPAPVISFYSPDTLISSASNGNQWYFENHVITGGIGQTQFVSRSGHYFVRVNPFGCLSDTSNIIYALAVGIDDKPIPGFKIYPNPGNGKLTILLSTEGEKKNLSIRVLDLLGKEIFRHDEESVYGEIRREIELDAQPDGIYAVFVRVGNRQKIQKIIILKQVH